MNEGEFLNSVGVSVWIAIVVLGLNLLIGITAGKVFSFSSFRGKSLIEALMMLPLFIPVLVVAIGLHITFIRYGLSDHWLGVALVHLVPTIPYSIKMFKTGYERIGSKLLEQSTILGGNAIKRLYHIELPLAPSKHTQCIVPDDCHLFKSIRPDGDHRRGERRNTCNGLLPIYRYGR